MAGAERECSWEPNAAKQGKGCTAVLFSLLARRELGGGYGCCSKTVKAPALCNFEHHETNALNLRTVQGLKKRKLFLAFISFCYFYLIPKIDLNSLPFCNKNSEPIKNKFLKGSLKKIRH